ncbi:MAG: methyltransferase domain-containing protein [Deltaproteobacteria bacterium]|nr:methyltransferase domain-containing protein [Candidatus Zymogenaceae bacterium]
MFEELERINHRPQPFEVYTADDLWTDEHTSKQMLAYHLNPEIDAASRSKEFIERSVDWIGSHFRLGENTSVADFGCGPGLYTNRLAAKWGAQVTGIDFSKRSIEYAQAIARTENITVRYIHQNYLEFEDTEQFDFIMMIMCDFCALSPDQRMHLLDTFYSLLPPGGSILLDVYSPNAFAQRTEAASYEPNLLNGFWSPHRYYGFLNIFKYEDEKVVLEKYTIVEKDRTRTVYNWLQCFTVDSLEKELHQSGFKTTGRYADVAGTVFDPELTEFAVVGVKE